LQTSVALGCTCTSVSSQSVASSTKLVVGGSQVIKAAKLTYKKSSSSSKKTRRSGRKGRKSRKGFMGMME
jgi:hypothetical protein